MPIFCVSPNFITSPSLKCWSISVSEIREFNRKKEKKKNSKTSFFFYNFPTVQIDPFFKPNLVGHNDAARNPKECTVKVKIKISLCTHLLDNHCHPYIPSTTVLGDTKEHTYTQVIPAVVISIP